MEEGGSPQWQTLPEMLAARAAAHPDRTALVYLERGEEAGPPLTYSALFQRARATAAWLQRRFAPGDRVMLVFPNEPDFITALMGCVLAGIIVVPAAMPRNARTIAKLWNLAETAGAAALIVSNSLRGLLDKHAGEVPPDRDIIFAEAVGQAPPSDFVPPELDARSLAVLQFTSGSTGNQKGVMVSHGNVLHNSRTTESVCGKGPSLQMVSWLPFFHDWGLFGTLFLPLFTGGSCFYFDAADFLRRPRRWPEAISALHATVACAPNFAYAACTPFADEPGAPVLDLHRWRVAMVGAEPVRKTALEGFAYAYAAQGFRHSSLFPSYGLAEATLMVTAGTPGSDPVYLDLDRAKLSRGRAVAALPGNGAPIANYVGCGTVLLDQDLRIVDPVTLQPCADRVVGEVWVSGGSVTQGYWRRPEATRDAFTGTRPDAPGKTFLRSGDLGFLVKGELFICGRMKDVIIKAGANHLAEDLEHAMVRADPALRLGCGAAFSVEAAGSERLVLVQEINYGKRPELPRLIGAIQKSVSEDHGVMADAILILAPGTLEKTSSGKIRRQATRSRFLEGGLVALQGWQGWT